jgi:hypothetical protein
MMSLVPSWGDQFRRAHTSSIISYVSSLASIIRRLPVQLCRPSPRPEPRLDHAPAGFKIAGNLYYVGSKDLTSYLITTPQGHILINSSLTTSVPLIRKSIEPLGFRFCDVRILLISHAHWGHAAGSALLKQLT